MRTRSRASDGSRSARQKCKQSQPSALQRVEAEDCNVSQPLIWWTEKVFSCSLASVYCRKVLVKQIGPGSQHWACAGSPQQTRDSHRHAHVHVSGITGLTFTPPSLLWQSVPCNREDFVSRHLPQTHCREAVLSTAATRCITQLREEPSEEDVRSAVSFYELAVGLLRT